MALPSIVAVGAAVAANSGTSPVVSWPAGHLVDDVLVIVMCSYGSAPYATPAGCTPVSGSPLWAGTTGPRLDVWWIRATSNAMPTVTVVDLASDDAKYLVPVLLRGCSTSGLPYNVVASDTQTASSSSVTIPGGTTTVDECLVLAIVAHGIDSSSAQLSAAANASLSSLVESADGGTSLGVGRGIAIISGGKALAGPVSATTATLAAASLQARMMIAFRAPSLESVRAEPLPDDGVPGNLGLDYDARCSPRPSVALLLHELAGVQPSDSAGALADMAAESPLAVPAVVESWTGRGRRFDPALLTGLVAADVVAGSSLCTRSCSVQVLLSITTGAAGTMTIISRGTDGSASEYYAYGIELVPGAVSGTYDVRWFWQTQAGAIHTAAAGTFASPGTGKTIMLTATRRWISSTRVVCRYYAGARLLAEVVEVVGAIGGGGSGKTSIGARKTAGSWGRHFDGVLDQVLVYPRELTIYEVEQTWRRMTVHQPEGVARWRALQPPSAPWSSDPSSVFGRLRKVRGQLLGTAMAASESLRNMLPDRCPEHDLERWERGVYRMTPAPLQDIEERRRAVIARESSAAGYSLPHLRALLAPFFQQDPEQIVFVRGSNTAADDFAAALNTLRWTARGPGAWSSAAGLLTFTAPTATALSPTVDGAPSLYMPIHEGDRGQPADGEGTSAQIRIASVSSWPSSGVSPLIVGLELRQHVSDDAVIFGLARSGVDYKLVHCRRVAGSLTAVTDVVTLGASPAVYLRLRRTSTATSVIAEYSTSTFSTMTAITITAPSGAARAGVAVVGAGTTVGALTFTCASWLLRASQARSVFHFYAYRDPALPGTPDMQGADRVLRKTAPAHAHVAAISTLAFSCGLPSGCGAGPLGGF